MNIIYTKQSVKDIHRSPKVLILIVVVRNSDKEVNQLIDRVSRPQRGAGRHGASCDSLFGGILRCAGVPPFRR